MKQNKAVEKAIKYMKKCNIYAREVKKEIEESLELCAKEAEKQGRQEERELIFKTICERCMALKDGCEDETACCVVKDCKPIFKIKGRLYENEAEQSS